MSNPWTPKLTRRIFTEIKRKPKVLANTRNTSTAVQAWAGEWLPLENVQGLYGMVLFPLWHRSLKLLKEGQQSWSPPVHR